MHHSKKEQSKLPFVAGTSSIILVGICFMVFPTIVNSQYEFDAYAYANQESNIRELEMNVSDAVLTEKEQLEIQKQKELEEQAIREEQERLVREEQEQLEAEQAQYVEETYYESTYYASSGNSYGNSFYSDGVAYDENGSYTWYSQNAPGMSGGGLTELNNNGRHVGDNGFIYDGDGYIAVSSDDYAQGSVVQTPWGEGKVYDTGSGSGNIDIYTDF